MVLFLPVLVLALATDSRQVDPGKIDMRQIDVREIHVREIHSRQLQTRNLAAQNGHASLTLLGARLADDSDTEPARSGVRGQGHAHFHHRYRIQGMAGQPGKGLGQLLGPPPRRPHA